MFMVVFTSDSKLGTNSSVEEAQIQTVGEWLWLYGPPTSNYRPNTGGVHRGARLRQFPVLEIDNFQTTTV